MDKVVSYDGVLLVRRDLDIVRTDCWLDGVWVVETLNACNIRDVEGCDMVVYCEGEVYEFSVLADVGTGRRV